MNRHRILEPYQEELHRLETLALRRHPSIHSRPLPDPQSDFTSNDYLALSFHPALREAAAAAARSQGTSASASYIVTGRSPQTEALENQLARHFPWSAATIFPSGYQANVGVLQALSLSGASIFSDAHNHASIVDACRLSKAHTQVYPHRDLEALENLLRKAPADGPRLIVTDALFSMTGALAPLADLRRLADRYHALLIVDEAHSFGVHGPDGAGLCASQGVVPDALVGTFSKALGAHGAFVAAHPTLNAILHSRARSLIYSTALPPPVVAAALAAVNLLPTQEISSRRTHVLSLAASLRADLRARGIHLSGDDTPIVAISFPDPTTAPRIAAHLSEMGTTLWAFRPPTVPKGTSLIRISLRADHNPEAVERLRRLISTHLAPAAPAQPNHPTPATQTPALKKPHPHEPPRPDPESHCPRNVLAVVGTDTGVGKTLVAAGLLTLLRTRGIRPAALKPFETGIDPETQRTSDGDTPDHLLLARAAGQPEGSAIVQTFTLPAAPSVAAAHEGTQPDVAAASAALRHLARSAPLLLLEGAGGLLVPITDRLLWLDLLRTWRTPVLLVCRLSLGTLNHTLLTARQLELAGLPVLAVVPNATHPPTPEEPYTVPTLARQLAAPVLEPIPHGVIEPHRVAEHLEAAGLLPLITPLLADTKPSEDPI